MPLRPWFRWLLSAIVCFCVFRFEAIAAETAGQKDADLMRNLQQKLIQRFAPLKRELVVVSPDGQYLACSVREGDSLFLVILPVEHLKQPKISFRIASAKSSRTRLSWFQTESSPEALAINPGLVSDETVPRIQTLRWVSSRSLVVTTNTSQSFAYDGVTRASYSGAIYLLNIDGTGSRELASAAFEGREYNFFQGFHEFVQRDANHVIIRVKNPAPDGRFEQFRALELDLRDGVATPEIIPMYEKALEAQKQRMRLLRAKQDPVLSDVRRLFPDMQVDLQGSDDEARVLTIRVHNPVNPGRLFMYHAATKQLVDLGDCQSDLPQGRYDVQWSDVADTDGIHAKHLLIRPAEGVYRRNGLVVFCPDKPAAALRNGYRREVMAYVDMGYSVLEIGGLSAPGRDPRHNYQAEFLRHIRDAAEWADKACGGKLSKQRALVAHGGHAIDLAYLSLWLHNDLYETGLFFSLNAVDSDPVSRMSEAYKGLREQKPEGVESGYSRQVLCFEEPVLSRPEQDAPAHSSSPYFAPLRRRRTYVDTRILPIGAVYLNQQAEWVPMYIQVADFLDAAFRKAHVDMGTSEVIKAPSKEAAEGSSGGKSDGPTH